MVYPITKLWFYPLTGIFTKRIKGIGNIPVGSNFIVVSNHEKLIDPLLIINPLLKKLNKKVHFIAVPTWWFLGEMLCRRWAGCIPLLNSKQAYEESKKIVRLGEVVGIFPEGGTRMTENPKTGIVRLAIETNTQILPIGIKSSYIPFNSTIKIGKLIHLKKSKNIKKQAKDLMKYIYRLRDES